MSEREALLKSIADTIADYRAGSVPRRTPKDVERWVSQFPGEAQDGILAEVDHLLSKTYISRDRMTSFLRSVATHSTLSGGDPKAFWKHASLLDIQKGGNSQREMLAMFKELLKREVGVNFADCGGNDGPFIYLDDGLFGGGRALHDLSSWIEEKAPARCEVRIVVAALHTSGQEYVDRKIAALNARTQKQVTLSWGRILKVRNRKSYRNESDVLWPTAIPSGEFADAYVRYLTEEEPRYRLDLRTPGSVGKGQFFSSDKSRIFIEQQFLTAGLQIRNKSTRLPETMRPLGATPLKTLGFGSTIVTFRNCPNNCPLVFWAEDPWYPLFPRSSNKMLKERGGEDGK